MNIPLTISSAVFSMKKEIAIGLISLFLLITGVIKSQAQTSFSIGQEISLEVDAVDENEYLWGVFLDENALIPANQDSYDFISSTEENHTKLVFHQTGSYFIILFETNPLGCSTGRSLRLEVIPSGDLGFVVSNATTSQCYQEGANDFTVDLQFFDAQGDLWAADRFPVTVSFAVNGIAQATQTLTYFNQQIQISDDLFTADPTQNTSVTVSLTEAVDAQNQTIQAREGQNIQTTTILSLPQISFNTEEDQLAFGTISAYSAQGPSNFTYHWSLMKPDGTILELSSQTSTTESIDWNQQGAHVLRVQTHNADGCETVVLSKTVVVTPRDDQPVAIIAEETLQTGNCAPIQLDASSSTGQGELSFSWTPTTGLDDPASPRPLFTPGSSASYTVTVTDSRGQTATDAVWVEVIDPPLLVLNKQVFVNNPTDVILLDASASAGHNLAFNWRSAGEGLIIAGSQSATPQVSGLGKYYLEVTDAFGCTARDSVTVGLLVQVTAIDDTIGVRINTYADINVLRNDKPQGQLDPESISIVSPPSHGFATISSDSIITYTPDQFYLGHDEFIYSVCDYSNRCDEATVLVRVSDEALFVPNGFSPNGDGLNDYFEIVGIGSYERVKLKIFNRWGNLVYESENYGPAGDGFWDGKADRGGRTSDGQLGTGTYYYILDLGRGNEKLSGFIYLDR